MALHPPNKHPRVFALLDQGGYNEYPDQLMQGVFQAAEEAGVQVLRIDFVNELDYEHDSAQWEPVFQLLEEISPDGILFLGWINALYGARFERFRTRFQGTPLYCLGMKIPGIPGNHVNGGFYVKAMLKHLVDEHHYRRVLFIPPYLKDDREEAYREFMLARNLYDPNLILDPELFKNLNSEKRAKAIVSFIFDEQQLEPEVLFTLYNYEALGIISELKKRGIRIPEDSAIVSFEDSRIADYLTPPLTTIEYPWRDLGYRGLLHFWEMIEGRILPGYEEIETRIHFRSSCGCSGEYLWQSHPEQTLSFLGLENDRLNDRLQKTLETTQQMTTSFDMEKLWKTFSRSLQRFSIPWAAVFLNQSSSAEELECVYTFPGESGISSLPDSLVELSRSEALGNKLVYPMLIGSEELGVVFFGLGEKEHISYRNLTVQLGTALKSSLLVNEIQATVEHLSKEIALRKEKERELARLVRFDSLTGVLNRHSLYDSLRSLCKTADPFGLFFLDLDGFKPVNDLLGHDAGDWLLQEMCKRILHEMEDRLLSFPGDIDGEPDYVGLFRLGGDEFTLLFRGGTRETLGRDGAELIRLLEKPFLLDDEPVRISCSIGISLFPEDSGDPDELIRLADTAMYRAKKKKGSYVFFNAEKDGMYLDKILLEKELEDSMEKGYIQVYYQPLYNRVGMIEGLEALARWEHPEKGLLKPYKFIHLLKNEKYDIRLGNYLLTKTCEQIGQLRAALAKDFFLLINCYFRQISDPGFKPFLLKLLGKHCIEPSSVRISISEIHLIKDRNRLFPILRDLEEAGISFAIDDYGQGNSSLNFLNKVPRETFFKINREYIAGIDGNEEKKESLKNLLVILGKLDIPAVLSGIENAEEKEEVDAMVQTGQKLVIQGYHFQRPLPFSKMLSHLQKENI